jgi:hypothetical protein
MPDPPLEHGDDGKSLPPEPISSSHATYNIVSDFVVGPNLRKRDNIWQALSILGSILMFAVVGGVLAVVNVQWKLPWYGGAVIGAFGGLIIGFFVSGFVLMVYRAVRHLQGKHD